MDSELWVMRLCGGGGAFFWWGFGLGLLSLGLYQTVSRGAPPLAPRRGVYTRYRGLPGPGAARRGGPGALHRRWDLTFTGVPAWPGAASSPLRRRFPVNRITGKREKATRFGA